MRALVPNIEVGSDGNIAEGTAGSKGSVPGLAFVACRPLKDEELLLNYRLSTHVQRPAWYKAIDDDEDSRRWA